MSSASDGSTIHRYSPGHCALVVVDVQNDFCDPQGTMAQRGLDLTGVHAAVTNVQRIVQAARESNIPLVFVRTEHNAEVDSVPWQHRFQEGIGGVNQPAPPNCQSGTWGAEWYKVQPLPHEPTVTKHRYGAFSTAEFPGIIEQLDRPSLLFVGIATNVCVETSARGAVDRDYLASIVRDASAAYDTAEHDASIATFGQHFGKTPTTEEVIRSWDSTARGSD